jgi:hypothetical protein
MGKLDHIDSTKRIAIPQLRPFTMIANASIPNLMQPSGRVRHAMSWELVAELHRQHPGEFTVIETQPWAGRYECLTLITREREVVANHIRLGGFYLKDQCVQSTDFCQTAIAEKGIDNLLERVCRACGWTVPPELPPMSPETLTYRTMAGVATA